MKNTNLELFIFFFFYFFLFSFFFFPFLFLPSFLLPSFLFLSFNSLLVSISIWRATKRQTQFSNLQMFQGHQGSHSNPELKSHLYQATSFVTCGNNLTSVSLSFLIHKTGIITVLTSLGCLVYSKHSITIAVIIFNKLLQVLALPVEGKQEAQHRSVNHDHILS